MFLFIFQLSKIKAILTDREAIVHQLLLNMPPGNADHVSKFLECRELKPQYSFVPVYVPTRNENSDSDESGQLSEHTIEDTESESSNSSGISAADKAKVTFQTSVIFLCSNWFP